MVLEVRQVRAYGLPEVAVGSEPLDDASPVLPLLLTVIALAAATIWFVWLPMTHKATGTSCEVYLLASGTTKCVPYGKPGSWATHQKSLRSD